MGHTNAGHQVTWVNKFYMVIPSIWGGGHQYQTCFISPLWHKVADRFLENLYTMVITEEEEEEVVSSNPEILSSILAEMKCFFQNGIVCFELSISHV